MAGIEAVVLIGPPFYTVSDVPFDAPKYSSMKYLGMSRFVGAGAEDRSRHGSKAQLLMRSPNEWHAITASIKFSK